MVAKKANKRKIKWGPGSLFAVPVSDKANFLGQVIAYKEKSFLDSVFCGFTLLDVTGLESHKFIDPQSFISLQHVTSDALKLGIWPIIGDATVPDFSSLADKRNLVGSDFVGKKIRDSKLIDNFLEACIGLRPWDEMFDPGYYDKMLMSSEMRPKGVVFKKTVRH